MTENPNEHHDDCEDCKREKKENEKYIAVYQRMQSLRKHVEKTGSFMKEHQRELDGVRNLSKSLDLGIKKAIKCQGDADNRSIEMMGYEIAASVMEKSVRNKILQDNEYLRKRIETIRKRSEQITHEGGERHCALPRISEPKNKVLNEIPKTPNINTLTLTPQETPVPQPIENDCDSCSTKFSFFKETKTRVNSSFYREKYRNMNLWLYAQQNFEETFTKLGDPFATKTRRAKPKPK